MDGRNDSIECSPTYQPRRDFFKFLVERLVINKDPIIVVLVVESVLPAENGLHQGLQIVVSAQRVQRGILLSIRMCKLGSGETMRSGSRVLLDMRKVPAGRIGSLIRHHAAWLVFLWSF